MPRRAMIVVLAACLLAAVVLLVALAAKSPRPGTPEAAYVAIAKSLSDGDARAIYSYLDDDARAACVTIWHDRKEASDLVERAYPVEPPPGSSPVEPPSGRQHLLDEYRVQASATDGADVWADVAARRGYVGRLRRDLSGVVKVETEGDHATIETSRGTRYEFRRRSDGLWGLTLFTADLVRDRDRAERDLEMIRRAAADYERARDRSLPHAP